MYLSRFGLFCILLSLLALCQTDASAARQDGDISPAPYQLASLDFDLMVPAVAAHETADAAEISFVREVHVYAGMIAVCLAGHPVRCHGPPEAAGRRL